MCVDDAISSNMFLFARHITVQSIILFSKQNKWFIVNLTLHDTIQQSQSGLCRLFTTQ